MVHLLHKGAHSYHKSMDGQTVTFKRHPDTGERRHKDPDHEFRLARLRGRQTQQSPPPRLSDDGLGRDRR